MPKWVLIDWPKIPQMPQNLPVCPSPLVLDFNENNFIGCPQSVCWALFLHKVINSMSFRLSTFPSQTLHKKNSERMFYWSALGHCRIQKDSNFTYKNHLLLSWKSRSVSIDKILSSQEKNELSKTIYFLFVVSSHNSKLERLSMIAQQQRSSTYLC